MALTKEEVLARVQQRRSQGSAPENPYKAQNQQDSGFDNFLRSLPLAAKKRALGILQLGMEAKGNQDTALYQDAQDLAQQYRQQGEGTGAAGFAGEILGDPLTYLPAGGAAKGGLTLSNIGKAALGYGVASSGTDALGEGEDRLTHTEIGTALSLATAPLVYGTGKAVQKTAPIIGEILADNSGKVGRKVREAAPKLSSAESTVYRTLVDDLGLSHQQAIDAVKKAGSGDIPLSLPEQVDSSKLLGLEKRLRQNAGKAGDIERAFTDMRAAVLPRRIEGDLSAIGRVQPLDVAGQRGRDAARKVFDVLKYKRSTLSNPLYEAGYKKTASPEAMQAVMEDPLTASVFTSMQKDPRVLSRLKEYPEGSLGWINEARKELSGRAGVAARQGDATAKKDYEAAAQRLRDIIDMHGGSEIKAANEAFAKASKPINKAEQSLVGILSNMEDGNVAQATQKLFAKGTTPAQIRYARRTIQAADPQAWDDMVASHMAYIGDTVNHSPVKFLNALSGELSTGNAYIAQKFDAALSKEQRAARDALFSSLKKASKIRMGSDTAMNQEAGRVLDNELSGGADFAIDAVSKGKGIKDLSLAAGDWVRGKIMEKRYEDLARIFTGQGSDEFVDKLSKMKPRSADAYRAIIERIGQIERGGTLAEVKAANTQEQEANPAAASHPKITKEQVLQRVKARRMSPQASLSPDIMQAEGLRHLAYNDTTGHRTVGYGFNMDSGIAKRVWKKAGVPVPFEDAYQGIASISDEHAAALGAASQEIAVADAQSFLPSFHKLSNGRKSALVNLSYQMGAPTLQKFTGFKTAMSKGDYRKAAIELVNSDYYKQTPDRARQVIKQILQG